MTVSAPKWQIRKAAQRGYADHGWLRTWHTFSFAGYFDSNHMRFRSLRVMNEDIVAPGGGFGTHPHNDMEIITIVLSGLLEHRDSMGNGEVLKPGELQRMTAGSGLTHSEFNPSSDSPLHLYQIWLYPLQKGLPPSWEQKAFDPTLRRNQWQVVASPDRRQGSLLIHQDATLLLADLQPQSSIHCEVMPGRAAWFQILRGSASVFGESVSAGDGVVVEDANRLEISSDTGAEILWFDLA